MVVVEDAGVTDSAARDRSATGLKATMAASFATESAFRAFYDQALPRIYGYLHDRCGGDAALAEELTQQTFVTAVRERARFDGRADPMTWLTAIARHKLADHFRRLSRDERRHLRLMAREITLDPEGRAWSRMDEREAVVAGLATLPALQRAVLVLHYADGLPIREVAAQLGKSESAIESLMTRAREAFRRSYGKLCDV
jgi:RNA polymerase sigma-70 factor (ECF subfamily)